MNPAATVIIRIWLNIPIKKLKILYLMKIMEQNTDDKHGLTMGEIITALRRYGIDSERKSLYDDFDVPKDFRHGYTAA